MFRKRRSHEPKLAAPVEVKLEDGGWFDASATIELISWKSYAPPALTRFRLLRTAGGSVVLEYPEPSVVLAGIRTTDAVLYRSVTPAAACAFLLENGGPQAEAARLFPAEWHAALEQHRSLER